MSPCRVHPGAPRICRGGRSAHVPYLSRRAPKVPNGTYGAQGITIPNMRLPREAPLTGVLVPATDPVNDDRSHLSEGQPE